MSGTPAPDLGVDHVEIAVSPIGVGGDNVWRPVRQHTPDDLLLKVGFVEHVDAAEVEPVSVAAFAVLRGAVQGALMLEKRAGRAGAAAVGYRRVVGVWGPFAAKRVRRGEQEKLIP